MKFSTAKLRNNFDFSKLLAFIFTIWCLFTLFFYHLTHGRNRNEVFSADFPAISISVISVISVFREPSWGTYEMRNMVWVNKKASSQRRESFLVIVACVSITDTFLPSRVYPSTLFDEASLGLDMIITPQTGE